MTESGQDQAPNQRRTRWIWWVAGVTTAIVLLSAAAFATSRFAGGGRPGSVAGPAEPATPPATPTPTPSPTPSPTPEPGAEVTGPLNVLLVGVDTRVSVPDWEPHADAVLILHVTKELDRAYLFALPRDLVVDIPAFPKAGFGGQRTKLTHAMSYGSRVPGKRNSPNTAQGFALVEKTVSRYTGIKRFDAGAVLTFVGFTRLVNALGGVDLYIDQRVVSLHRQPNGKHRDPGDGGYVGPQMVYEPGQRHLTGWQALDYARQRYIDGGAYSRQRHQQQLIKAIVGQVRSQELARDPDRMDQVVQALGDTLTFQGQGQRVLDFAFALSRLEPAAITLVALPGSAVENGGYQGEQLDPLGTQFITELRAGRVDAFLTANPKLVIKR